MSEAERKGCFYYDKDYERVAGDGCFTCAECGIAKCPEAVKRMSENDKKLYGVKE